MLVQLTKLDSLVKKKKVVLMVIFFIVDLDECNVVVGACDDHANCQNTEGSYSCACMTGFTGDGKTCTGETN